jgi:thioredoxin reductase
VAGLLLLNKESYVITDELMKTDIPRIFTAIDSATAAMSAEAFSSF